MQTRDRIQTTHRRMKMINSEKYEAVNWVDGMKISQQHFDAHTNFILDGFRDVRAVFTNVFNYGLLPIHAKKKEQAIFEVYDSLTGDVEVVIKHCSALTPAGFRIDLTDFTTSLKGLIPVVGEELYQQHIAYYLIVSVNPFDKIPYGTLDLEESPPRYPFTKPRHRIEFMPVTSFDTSGVRGESNFIVLGKVIIQGETIQPDLQFIPPCTSMMSHPLLLHAYNRAATSLPMLQKYAMRIFQKNAVDKQKSKLASSVKQLCQVLVHDIGSAYFHFRNVIPHVSPIYFVACFSQLAIHLHQVTQVLSPVELEEMLNYIGEWSDIAPHVFLHQLTHVAEIKYQHMDCAIHVDQIQILLSSLEKIFLQLSELDYIGQRKENIIITALDVTPTPKTNRGWSVLD